MRDSQDFCQAHKQRPLPNHLQVPDMYWEVLLLRLLMNLQEANLFFIINVIVNKAF